MALVTLGTALAMPRDDVRLPVVVNLAGVLLLGAALSWGNKPHFLGGLLRLTPEAAGAMSSICFYAFLLWAARRYCAPGPLRAGLTALLAVVLASAVRALPDGPRPDGAALLLALRRVCDALLVLHSLGDAAAHGAASAEAVWYFSPGDADAAALPCLYVPPVPPACGAADDLCAFGEELLQLLPPDAPHALCAILTRMRAGGYASALEIRHELNCL